MYSRAYGSQSINTSQDMRIAPPFRWKVKSLYKLSSSRRIATGGKALGPAKAWGTRYVTERSDEGAKVSACPTTSTRCSGHEDQ